ncbi:MAG: flagellar basal body protein [Planctomycetota bacterium]|nr:flagellar basal body protein [Planctomycetota bacterium]
MLGSVLEGSAIPALEQTIQFAERRHALLASNIANVSTPGYKTRDLSVKNFQSSLQEAIEATRSGDRGLSASDSSESSDGRSGPIAGISKSQAMENVRESMKQILFHDGSDIGLETQVTEISKNQSMHSMAIAVMRNQMTQFSMAIRESVNV